MEVDPALSSLIHLLEVEGPRLPPKTWESIPSQSGIGASVACKPKSTYDWVDSTVSEAALVRLVINALQGVRAALDDIDRISAVFTSTPADSTPNSVPNIWHRSSSTNALGRLLKSFSRAGYTFCFLSHFADYFLNVHTQEAPKVGKIIEPGTQAPVEMVGCNLTAEDGGSQRNTAGHTPYGYSLVNQAFAVALRNILHGHLCALDTLHASVKLRRSLESASTGRDKSSRIGCPINTMKPGITVLEVHLHTNELRSRIEALGNICCLSLDELLASISSGGSIGILIEKAFSHFPRGADLLSYLYVQLRDSDPVHCGLLKYLFGSSCQPYFGFIKSWIYSAKADDLFGEFFVQQVESTTPASSGVGKPGASFLPIKERAGVSVPCFLESVRVPILRAGFQLQVLIKLLNFFNDLIKECYNGEGLSIHLPGINDVLPSGFSPWSSSLFCSSSFIFTREGIGKMLINRDMTYKRLYENLEIYFTRLNAGNCQNKDMVNSSHSMSPLDRGVCKDFSASSFLEKLDIPEPCMDHYTSIRQGFPEEANTSCSLDDSLAEMDPAQQSDSSSLDGSEELNDFTQFSKLQDIYYEDPALNALNTLQPSYHEHPPPKGPTCENSEYVSEMNSQSLNHLHVESDKLSQPSYPFEFGKLKDTRDNDYLPIRCWPLGALPRNPFCPGTKSMNQCHDDCISSLGTSDENQSASDCADSFLTLNMSEPNLFVRCPQISSTYSKSFFRKKVLLPWNYASNYDLNMNPLLSKSSEIRAMNNSLDKHFMSDGRSSSFFNFSSVEDPYEVFLKRSTSHSICEEEPLLPDSDVIPHSSMTGHIHKSDFHSPYRTQNNPEESFSDKDISENVIGGASWTGMLRQLEQTMSNTDNIDCKSTNFSEIPLDIVIDRCILQEIVLQYNYVSKFTIRLFEEGFGLHGHFLALHRYHFMESADWVNTFVASLWNHKWFARETNQRIGDLQNLLDQALRKSSCNNDPYKQRLYIYLKENSGPLSMADIGCFDFIRLGYRVDWPINVLLDPGTLGVYADIFSFLTKVRLAKLVLADLWRPRKAAVELYPQCKTINKAQNQFTIFDKARLQINHFVSMLEQYVQSELSVVSWCRLLYSLKHQVKDILDIKVVQTAYLADTLRICFLSTEAQTTYMIIRDILQCALKFQSCLTGNLSAVGFDEQIFSIKAAFEQNLNDLYNCYLKSSNSSEPGLHRFWRYLDFNEYYSNVLSVGTNH